MQYGSYFKEGDRVRSVATFEHYNKRGTVIELKKPAYIPWGTIIAPLVPVVCFDDGQTVTMRENWLMKEH